MGSKTSKPNNKNTSRREVITVVTRFPNDPAPTGRHPGLKAEVRRAIGEDLAECEQSCPIPIDNEDIFKGKLP